LSEYKLSNELKPFLKKEIASKDFSLRSKGSIVDRLNVVNYLDKIGEKATADSLIEIEKKAYNLKSLETKYEFGAKLVEGGLLEQAYDIYKGVIAEDPSNSQAHEILTYIMYQLGKYQEALTEVNTLLKLSPNNENALKTKDMLEKMLNMKSPADSSVSVRTIPQAAK
jgi:tetratricopeptide (TPR) repeat protein